MAWLTCKSCPPVIQCSELVHSELKAPADVKIHISEAVEMKDEGPQLTAKSPGTFPPKSALK